MRAFSELTFHVAIRTPGTLPPGVAGSRNSPPCFAGVAVASLGVAAVPYTCPVSSQPGTSPAASSGQNEWLVEEMFAQYQSDPTSVSESWRDFFTDYRPAE